MPTIFESNNFQKEYQLFMTKLDEIENELVRSQADVLIKQLVSEIRHLDNQQMNMFMSKGTVDEFANSKNKISELRKKIYTLLQLS